MNILSVQSWVAYGHVGNAAAVFPLQRLGAEVWAVNTVQFSNHPGRGGYRGQAFAADHIAECVAGIAERGWLAKCDAVLSGFLGTAAVGLVVADAVQRTKAANPAALYCCDPVIGDGGQIYVEDGIPEIQRDRLLPLADIATPNAFELAWLTDQPVDSLAEARRAIATLHARGPRCVLATSLSLAETPAGWFDLLVSEGGHLWRCRTPRIEGHFDGAGDTIAALFLFHYLRAGPAIALATAASSMHGLLQQTAAAGSLELLSIAAQDEFVRPSQFFPAEEIP